MAAAFRFELQKDLPFALQGLQFCLGVEPTSSHTNAHSSAQGLFSLGRQTDVRQSLTPFLLLLAPAADMLLPSSLPLYGNSWLAVPALSSWTNSCPAG
jgi:hypothetical protein